MKTKKAAARKSLKIDAPRQDAGARDMYMNQAANVGFGTTSQVNAGRYVPYRISLNYLELLHIYRGSWIARAVVDTIPEDMLKAFPTLVMDTTPEDISAFNRVVAKTHTLNKVIEACKWGRLFGGAIGIVILQGQDQKDLTKPLKLEDVQPDSYRGILVVDRWSGCSPSSELISDIDNPAEYGLPVYYEVTTEVSQTFRVHHSRILRFTGRDLPLFEKQIQTYWGMSELEAVLEELKRRDFSAAGIADLISRAHVIIMKEPMLAQMLAGVSLTQQQYVDYVTRMQAVSESISTNGILALSETGDVQSQSYSFSGLSEIYETFMLDIAGACGIPVSRLYGRSITGLGQSGEGDLQVYYDSIDQKRNHELRPVFDKLIPIICMSTFGEVPEDLDYNFAPIRTMNSKERAQLAKDYTEPILAAMNAGAFGRKTLLRELQSTSGETGVFTNITDEDIAAADDEVQAGDVAQEQTETEGGGRENVSEGGVKDWVRHLRKRVS